MANNDEMTLHDGENFGTCRKCCLFAVFPPVLQYSDDTGSFQVRMSWNLKLAATQRRNLEGVLEHIWTKWKQYGRTEKRALHTQSGSSRRKIRAGSTRASALRCATKRLSLMGSRGAVTHWNTERRSLELRTNHFGSTIFGNIIAALLKRIAISSRPMF